MVGGISQSLLFNSTVMNIILAAVEIVFAMVDIIFTEAIWYPRVLSRLVQHAWGTVVSDSLVSLVRIVRI